MSKNKIEIIQIKSAIGYNVKVKKTLEALGIKKMNHKIIKDDNTFYYLVFLLSLWIVIISILWLSSFVMT